MGVDLVNFRDIARERRNQWKGDCGDATSALERDGYLACCVEDPGRPAWCETDADCATTTGKHEGSDRWDPVIIGNCCLVEEETLPAVCEAVMGSDSEGTSEGTSEDEKDKDDKDMDDKDKDEDGKGSDGDSVQSDGEKDGKVDEDAGYIGRRVCANGIRNPNAKCFRQKCNMDGSGAEEEIVCNIDDLPKRWMRKVAKSMCFTDEIREECAVESDSELEFDQNN